MGREASGPPVAAPTLVVDVNTAPAEVLVALPKLGPTLAGRIVEARREAPFRSFHDIDSRVRGIGPATIAALQPHLRIGPSAAPNLPASPEAKSGAR
jgi:competence protein ComEA